jgi:hypothetical protein
MNYKVNPKKYHELKPFESMPMEGGSLGRFEEPSAASPTETLREPGAHAPRSDAPMENAGMAMAEPHHRKAHIGKKAGSVAVMDAAESSSQDESLLAEMKANFVSGYRDGYRGWRRSLRQRIKGASKHLGR